MDNVWKAAVDRRKIWVYHRPPVTDLEHIATTSLRPEVLEAVIAAARLGGNPSSLHQPGQRAHRMVEAGREAVRRLLGAPRAQVIFTASGTEANHLGMTALARWQRVHQGRHRVLCLPGMEKICGGLTTEGFTVTALPPPVSGGPGEVLPDDLKQTLAVVAMRVAPKEAGVEPPVAEWAKAAAPGWVHLDGGAAVGRAAMSFVQWGAASLALSAHRFGGPPGIGVLVLRPDIDPDALTPLWRGGGQERGLRSGTQALPLVAGLTVAAELLLASMDTRKPGAQEAATSVEPSKEPDPTPQGLSDVENARRSRP